LIYVAAPVAEVDSQLRTLTLLLAMNGLVAVLSAVVVGYFMARRVLTPIQTITDISRRVTSEYLAERVPVLNPKDELGQLSMTLNDTFDRLQRSIDELRRFTADAAHELRTPLTIIRTEVEVALRELEASGEKSPNSLKRMTNIVLAESGRLTDLVEQLLTLSRREAGLDRVSIEEISLRELLLDVIETLRIVADNKGVNIDASGLSSRTVVGDDISLSQLFFNLIDNAIRYTPSGGTVTVQMDGEPSVVRITVSDTGIGIDQKHLNHLFERFYRVESSRSGGGTGLGLAICHSVVTAHSGSIQVQSIVGQGTQFIVKFPTNP
jgi:signal transduction histidine kinase